MGVCSFVVIHGMLVGELFPYDHKSPKVGGKPLCVPTPLSTLIIHAFPYDGSTVQGNQTRLLGYTFLIGPMSCSTVLYLSGKRSRNSANTVPTANGLRGYICLPKLPWWSSRSLGWCGYLDMNSCLQVSQFWLLESSWIGNIRGCTLWSSLTIVMCLEYGKRFILGHVLAKLTLTP